MKFEDLAAQVVADYDGNLAEFGPEEQRARVVDALAKFNRRTPLQQHVEALDLFGFARTHSCLAVGDTLYFRLLPAARQLGMTEGQAHRWARQERLWALEDQREQDEETGQLGWECLDDLIDLRVELMFDDETAGPDHNGRRWSAVTEWLVSDHRIFSLMLASPWAKEFMHNTIPLFSHAMKASGLADQLGSAPTLDANGKPTGETLGDVLARDRDAMSEQEAVRRAMRGPGLDLDGDR